MMRPYCIYVFDSLTANEAAKAVNDGQFDNIIQYHNNRHHLSVSKPMHGVSTGPPLQQHHAIQLPQYSPLTTSVHPSYGRLQPPQSSPSSHQHVSPSSHIQAQHIHPQQQHPIISGEQTTTRRYAHSNISYPEMSSILESMQDIMAQHRLSNLSPKLCLKKFLYDRFRLISEDDTNKTVPVKRRRKKQETMPLQKNPATPKKNKSTLASSIAQANVLPSKEQAKPDLPPINTVGNNSNIEDYQDDNLRLITKVENPNHRLESSNKLEISATETVTSANSNDAKEKLIERSDSSVSCCLEESETLAAVQSANEIESAPDYKSNEEPSSRPVSEEPSEKENNGPVLNEETSSGAQSDNHFNIMNRILEESSDVCKSGDQAAPKPSQSINVTKTNVQSNSNQSRRRSNEKREKFCEGLMRTSDFVVAIKDLKLEHPPLWKITSGNNLLQEFESKSINGVHLYESTDKYAGWNPEIKRDYVGVDVKILSRNRTKEIAERMQLNFEKLEDSENFHDKHFLVYLQILISTALDPKFWESIESESEHHDYFLTSRKIVDETIKRQKSRLSSRLKLSESMMKNFEKYPDLIVKPMDGVKQSQTCRACNTNPSTQVVSFENRSYDLHSYKPVKVTSEPSKIDERDDQTLLCDSCLSIVKLYSEVHHMGWKFFNMTLQKVDQLRSSGKPVNAILDECLNDEDWVNKNYAERDSLWCKVNEIQSGNTTFMNGRNQLSISKPMQISPSGLQPRPPQPHQSPQQTITSTDPTSKDKSLQPQPPLSSSCSPPNRTHTPQQSTVASDDGKSALSSPQSTASCPEVFSILESMQDIMAQHKQSNLSPKSCLKKFLYDRFRLINEDDTNKAVPVKRRRKKQEIVPTSSSPVSPKKTQSTLVAVAAQVKVITHEQTKPELPPIITVGDVSDIEEYQDDNLRLITKVENPNHRLESNNKLEVSKTEIVDGLDRNNTKEKLIERSDSSVSCCLEESETLAAVKTVNECKASSDQKPTKTSLVKELVDPGSEESLSRPVSEEPSEKENNGPVLNEETSSGAQSDNHFNIMNRILEESSDVCKSGDQAAPKPSQSINVTKTNVQSNSNQSRRRSNEKREKFCEGLMRTSDFVVAIKDLKLEHPPLWKITSGNNLLQEFESKSINGVHLYESTDKYAGWNPEIKRDYVGVDVKILSRNRTKEIAERMQLNFEKLEDSENFHDKHFLVYLQILISTALDPKFWESIESESEHHDYFLTSRKIVDETIKRQKSRLSSRLKLSESMMKNFEKYPDLIVKPMDGVKQSQTCRACNTNPSTQVVSFENRSYDLHSYKPVKVTSEPSKIDERDDQTLLCDSCLSIVKLYSEVHHMGWKFFNMTLQKVDQLRSSGKPVNAILDECLNDEDWVNKNYAERDSLWCKVNEVR